MVGQTTSSGKRKRGSEGEEIDDGHNRHNKEPPTEDEDGGGAGKGEASSQPPSAASLASFLQDEALYRAFRHAPLPAEVAHTLRRRAEWGAAGGGGVGANQQRFGEEAVRQKQAELDRANNLYKALARKSFQLSVTLLTTQPDNNVGQHPMPSHATTPSSSSSPSSTSSSSTTDIYRTMVLPAAMPLSKLHKTLQMTMGWEDTQKYMFLTRDGVPIAKYHKDEIPCLSDSKIRLAYIVRDSGDEFFYQYGEWTHRLLVETIGAPRRNIPSTRVISGSGQCPPEGSTPLSYTVGESAQASFSVDVVNAQLMAGQTFYMRIPATASKEQEEYVCLRAMRTPVNILSTPVTTNPDPPPLSSSISSSSSSTSISSSSVKPEPATTISSAIRSSSPTSSYSSPVSAGLPSTASSPPVPHFPSTTHSQQHQQHTYRPAPADRYAGGGGSSLPGLYYPAHLHNDLAGWREDVAAEQRHSSAPSLFPMSTSTSTTSTPLSAFGIPARSTAIPSLPSPFSSLASFSSSSYPLPTEDEAAEAFYARNRYPSPMDSPSTSYPYAQHSHHSYHQQHPQPSYSATAAPYPSLPPTTTTPSGSSLLPFPSHTLPPFVPLAPSASSSSSLRAPAHSLFPPPPSSSSFSSQLGLYSQPDHLGLPPYASAAERLPPLSGTAAEPSSLYSALPPFQMPMSPPPLSSHHHHHHVQQQQHQSQRSGSGGQPLNLHSPVSSPRSAASSPSSASSASSSSSSFHLPPPSFSALFSSDADGDEGSGRAGGEHLSRPP